MTSSDSFYHCVYLSHKSVVYFFFIFFLVSIFIFFFFFNDTATTEIYTLSLHDALPILSGWFAQRIAICTVWFRKENFVSICCIVWTWPMVICHRCGIGRRICWGYLVISWRSEEHTSELQSHSDLVCRLLLEKKKQ